MDQLCQFPSLQRGIILYPHDHFVTVDAGTVAVIGILDEDAVLGKGQRINEAVAVDLFDGSVHYNGVRQAVGSRRAILLTDKFLPAKIKMVEVGDPAPVKNAVGCNLALIAQINRGL